MAAELDPIVEFMSPKPKKASAATNSDEEGTVVKPTPKDDRVFVTFKTETWVEDNVYCTETW